jgi:hypothetical protein
MAINHLDGNIYSVNGAGGISSLKPIAVSGTALLEPDNTARFGMTLHNAILGAAPVSWEFTCDIAAWTCSGNYQWLTSGEQTGTLSLSLTPASVSEGTAAIGISSR